MPPKHMRKTCILAGGLFTTVIAFSQKKSNPKIGKNETEITSFVLGDDYLAFGVQAVYRVSVVKKLKVGGGIMYGPSGGPYVYDPDFSGYGALFIDGIQFLGQRQKWSFGGQLGKGLYNYDYDGYDLRAGVYYSISCSYRSILSTKLLFSSSFFVGYRDFHYKEAPELPLNSGFIGLRFGLVF